MAAFNPLFVERRFRARAFCFAGVGFLLIFTFAASRVVAVFLRESPLLEAVGIELWPLPNTAVCLEGQLFPIPGDIGTTVQQRNVSKPTGIPVTIRFGADMQYCTKYMKTTEEMRLSTRGIYLVEAEVEYTYQNGIPPPRTCYMRDQSTSTNPNPDEPGCFSDWGNNSLHLSDQSASVTFEGCGNAVVTEDRCSSDMIFSYDFQSQKCRCLNYGKTCDEGYGLLTRGTFYRLFYPSFEENTHVAKPECPRGYFSLSGTPHANGSRVFATTIQGCSAVCTRVSSCKSFEWNQRRAFCVLNKISNAGENRFIAGWTFCSRCLGTTCPSWRKDLTLQSVATQSLKNLETPCPWLRTSGISATLTCMDGSTCNKDTNPLGWRCCNDHGGRSHCPPEYPNMCLTPNECADNGAFCCSTGCSVHAHVGNRLCPQSRVSLGSSLRDIPQGISVPRTLEEVQAGWEVPVKFTVGRSCWASTSRIFETGATCPVDAALGDMEIFELNGDPCVRSAFSNDILLDLEHNLVITVSFDLVSPGRLKQIPFQRWLTKEDTAKDTSYKDIVPIRPIDDFLPAQTRNNYTKITEFVQMQSTNQYALTRISENSFGHTFPESSQGFSRKFDGHRFSVAQGAEKYQSPDATSSSTGNATRELLETDLELLEELAVGQGARQFTVQFILHLSSNKVRKFIFLEKDHQILESLANLGGVGSVLGVALGLFFVAKEQRYHTLTWRFSMFRNEDVEDGDCDEGSSDEASPSVYSTVSAGKYE